MKKWNVSCEPYGRRWHAGAIIGVLVDMDLLEMRYYMNGTLAMYCFTVILTVCR